MLLISRPVQLYLNRKSFSSSILKSSNRRKPKTLKTPKPTKMPWVHGEDGDDIRFDPPLWLARQVHLLRVLVSDPVCHLLIFIFGLLDLAFENAEEGTGGFRS